MSEERFDDLIAPAATGPRWTIAQSLAVWLVGVVAGTLALGISVALGADADDPLVIFGPLLAAQTLGWIGAISYLSRTRGTGSLATDFGLTMVPKDLLGLLYGFGLLIVLGLLTYPLLELFDRTDEPGQEVLEIVEEASGLEVALAVIFVAVVTPVAEELLFRGLLLKAMSRRLSGWKLPVANGVLFGVIHLVDPQAALQIPALSVLGIVLAYQAVRTQRLGLPIFTHMGINLVSVVATVIAA